MSYLHLLQIWVALPCVPHNSHPIMKKKKEKNQYIRQNKNKKRRPSNGGFRIFSLFCTCDKTEKHVFSISSPSSSKFTIFLNLITNKDSRRSFLAINTYQFPWIILWQSQNLKKFQKNLILYFFKPEVQDCTVYFFFWIKEQNSRNIDLKIIYNYHSCRFIEDQQLKIYHIPYSNTNKDSRRSFLAINTYQFPWIILWQSQNLKKFQKNLILYFFKPEVQDCTVYFFFWIKEQNSRNIDLKIIYNYHSCQFIEDKEN